MIGGGGEIAGRDGGLILIGWWGMMGLTLEGIGGRFVGYWLDIRSV
jgi:hypothetical protein